MDPSVKIYSEIPVLLKSLTPWPYSSKSEEQLCRNLAVPSTITRTRLGCSGFLSECLSNKIIILTKPGCLLKISDFSEDMDYKNITFKLEHSQNIHYLSKPWDLLFRMCAPSNPYKPVHYQSSLRATFFYLRILLSWYWHIIVGVLGQSCKS